MAQSGLEIESPYSEQLTGILSFSSLADAEETIKRLEIFRLKYRSLRDKKGVEYCRQIALLGRRRAELISRNTRVGPQKRKQKGEIALWFEIWVEAPDIFENWLMLRKKTKDYQELIKFEGSDRH